MAVFDDILSNNRRDEWDSLQQQVMSCNIQV